MTCCFLLIQTHLSFCLFFVTFFISSSPQYVQNDSPSSKSLAGLVVQLLQFQEDAFGRRVNNPALTKLPVRLILCISKKKTSRKLLNTHCCSATFRPNASLISRQGALSVTSWGLCTSSRASRGGESVLFLLQTCLNLKPPLMVILTVSPCFYGSDQNF